MLDNHGQRFSLEVDRQQVEYGERISVTGSAVGCRDAAIWQGTRKVDSVIAEDGRWQLSIDFKKVGVGLVMLGVRVCYDVSRTLRGSSFTVNIDSPLVSGKDEPWQRISMTKG